MFAYHVTTSSCPYLEICVCDAGLNTRRGAGLGINCSGDCSHNYVIVLIPTEHVLSSLCDVSPK